MESEWNKPSDAGECFHRDLKPVRFPPGSKGNLSDGGLRFKLLCSYRARDRPCGHEEGARSGHGRPVPVFLSSTKRRIIISTRAFGFLLFPWSGALPGRAWRASLGDGEEVRWADDEGGQRWGTKDTPLTRNGRWCERRPGLTCLRRLAGLSRGIVREVEGGKEVGGGSIRRRVGPQEFREKPLPPEDGPAEQQQPASQQR